MNRTVFCAAATVFFWFVSAWPFTQVAPAYVPQGAHLLALMIEEIGTPETILVRQKQFLLDVKSGNRPVVFNETLRYQLPQKFRSDIQTDQADWIRVLSGRRCITVLHGQFRTDRPRGFDLYPELLLIRSRSALGRRLTETGIDIAQSSLGRFQGEPVYVIGAQYPDLSRPQLWLDKKTLRPVCWIVGARSDHVVKEIRYLEWKALGPYGYPMRIEFYRDGELVRRAEVQDVSVNEFFEESLFDIDSLYTVHSADPADVPSNGTVGSDVIQQSIDEFRKIMD
jgi:hypothetical protein